MENAENDAKPTIAVLRGLRQVRQFSDKPVPPDVITDILEVGRWTGSGMNAQPWDLILVRNRDTLRAIADAEGKASHLARASFAVVVVMSGQGEIATYDEARLVERMMLAAAAHGVAAGIWWFKDGGAAARRILGIPAEKQVRSAISFGYAAEAPAPRPGGGGGRKPLSELVHEEHY
jgi:nitroreductase